MAPSGAGWAQRCGEEGTWPRGGGRGPDPAAGVLPAGLQFPAHAAHASVVPIQRSPEPGAESWGEG